MQLTMEQNNFIKKQYIRLLNKRISLDKCNENLQSYFNLPDLDFRSVIKDCINSNKGSYDIGWFLYDHA